MIWQFIDSSSVGGAERHVETLAASLQARGHAVRVVLFDDHGPNPWRKQLAAQSIDTVCLDGRSSTLLAALRGERPSLLHTHAYKAGIIGRFAARLAGVPVVSTFHSGQRGPMPVGAYEWLDDWTSILGQRIAVSAAIAARLPYRAAVIPSYVRTADRPPGGPLPRVAVFAGRLSAEKGPDTFCRIAARARADARFGDIEWQVWGGGALHSQLAATYGDVVQFRGVAVDMDAVWRDAGLLVMPSRFEGVPLAALEAIANGIPVLASDVGGLPSVVEDDVTGWLFQPGDVEGALAGLGRWAGLSAGATTMLRAACWQRARDRFSEARWLPDILAVYRAAGFDVGGASAAKRIRTSAD